MEGRWGRRVWGRVWREESHTWFHLEITLEPDRFVQFFRVANDQIDLYPNLYGWTLDQMVVKLEETIKNKQGER